MITTATPVTMSTHAPTAHRRAADCPVRARAEHILLVSFGDLAERWLAKRGNRTARATPVDRGFDKNFVQRSKKVLQTEIHAV